MSRPFARDRRGLTPAIGKALEVAVVVVFVGVLSASLYGGFVPSYRAAVGDEVADRTVVAAAEQVENAIPPTAREVRAVHRVDLPTSIRGANYRVVAENRTLVLDHPDGSVGARARLALPDRVASVAGTWESGGDPVVLVEGGPDGLAVRLADGDELDSAVGTSGVSTDAPDDEEGGA